MFQGGFLIVYTEKTRNSHLCEDKNYQILRTGSKAGTVAFDTSSKLSRKIELMSTYSSLDYLKLKQKNWSLKFLESQLKNEFWIKEKFIKIASEYFKNSNYNQHA